MPSSSGGVRRAPLVVGRERELDHLLRAVHTVRAGGSGCAFVLGEGGVGKTRLLTEIATESRHLGLAVMSGRSPVTTPVAFSVVAEALRSWLRGLRTEVPMPPFDAGLRLLLPEWPADTASATGLSDAQLRLLALEGVVRLVQRIAETSGGALVVLDDLHAADADSIEAVRYLASASPTGVLLVGALRSREGSLAERVVRGLQRDGIADTFDVDALGRREVADLLGALLDCEPPRELVDDVYARTDGVPLLVEEVLEAHLNAGALVVAADGASWRGGSSAVSRTVRDMVEVRLDRLTTPHRGIVSSAAVLGDFAPELLASVARAPVEAVGEAITAATDAGLVESVAGAVAFRHALVREAVLEATPPHTRQTLHERAAAALADVPDPDATVLERRAEHLASVDDGDRAATLLTDAATIRLAEHALLSAEGAARRALDLSRTPGTRAAASDALARVLATQGRWSEALLLDEEADAGLGDRTARRHRMAACAIEAAQPDRAERLVAEARADGDDSPRIHVLAGRLAMTAGRPDDALAAAERALAVAAEHDDLGARCAALDVQGRALDYLGRRADARRAWTRQAEEASAGGLTDARVRAVVQLGKLEVFDGAKPERLYEAVEVARAAGALVEQAWAEENLAIALIVQGEPVPGATMLDAAIARCRELRLDQLPYLLAARGGAAAMLGLPEAEEYFEEAERLAPTADLMIHTFGIRADKAFYDGRYSDALDWTERCVELIRASPGGMPSDAPCWLVWALALAGRFAEAEQALRDARALPDDLARWHGRPVVLAAAEAMLNRDPAGIDAALASATGRMPFELAHLRVLSAEIVGGPDRARWLREALDLYESIGVRDTARLRQLLREAGGPVPRRRRPAAAVPEELAEHRVTAREAEVLQLLGEGLSNAAIAERLFVSVRTVETHVSSLLAKLHAEGRGQLTAFSANVTYGAAPR